MSQAAQNGIFIRTTQNAKRDLKINNFSSFRCLAVNNHQFVAVVGDKTVVYRNLLSSSKQNEINCPISSSDSILYLHLSPNGAAAILSSKAGDNFYLNLKTGSPAPLKRIKDVISAVAWNPSMKEADSSSILLGTPSGAIIETSIQASGNVVYVKEHMFCFRVDKADSSCISDMYLFVVNDDEPKTAKYALFIAQPSKLHCVYATVNAVPPKSGHGYMSSASLQNLVVLPEIPQFIFHPFFSKDAQQTCISMVKSASSSSGNQISGMKLHSHGRSAEEPFKFVWLGCSGFTLGTINLLAETPRDIMKEEFHLEHRRVEGKVETPMGVSLTEYHVLLAYSTRLIAIGIHSSSVMFEDIWPTELGYGLGFTCDSESQSQYLFTGSTILKFRANDEARYAWRVFLDKGDFARALAIAHDRLAIDPEAHQLVIKRQADKFISEKNFSAAAELLSQSNEAFETVVLKFLSTEEDRRIGLKTLLEKKLERLTGIEDRIKRDLLILWLIDIQLAELSEARRDTNKDVSTKRRDVAELNSQLQRFLTRKSVHDCIVVNREAIYKLFDGHADFDTKLFVAKHLKDFETMIDVLIMRQHYTAVLDILISQDSTDGFYKYGLLLVEHIPKEFFHCVNGNRRIQAAKLLPVLCKCQDSQVMAESAIKYIEWAVTINNLLPNVELHNLLILLYAKFNPSKLRHYLIEQELDKTAIPYDMEFAMRTCEHYDLKKSMVYLYCVSELFAEAVELALKLDIGLAKECASLMRPSEDEELMGLDSNYPKEYRRKIWMRIASFVMETTKDAKACIALIEESGNVITIQDIFPLFPDFTKIADLKDSLCACLEKHSKEIETIQRSLKESVEIADQIRERAEKTKNRVIIVKAGDQCASCSKTLAGRSFFPFACRHFFHRECLEKEMLPFLKLETQKRLADLAERERRVLTQLEIEERSNSKASSIAEKEQRYDEISAQINEILASDCPLCGFIAIDLIDKPFFSDVDYANDLDSWKISI